jgi:hypothetical protein
MVGLFTLLAGVVVLTWNRWPGQQIPDEPPASVKPSPKGWQIRYNAAIALAVKGSKKVPFRELTEMLDENKQLKNFRVKLKDGRDVPDEAGARKTLINTLRALAEWHRKLDVGKAFGPDDERVSRLHAAIDNLAANSPNRVVKLEARRTQETCRRQS